MKKISIIVPIYGVEEYIEKGVRSLFEQTYKNLEYIFINDCTKDRSIEILQSVLSEYPERQANAVLLSNEQNLGQSGTRKKGILSATGDYMIHFDPDDWVDLDFYEKIAEKIEETGADIICCDYRGEFGNGKYKDFIFEDYKHPHDKIRSAYQKMWSLGCNCVKASLIKENNILPPEGINMTEDMNMLMRVFYFASTVANVHGTKYHYLCLRENSITSAALKSKKMSETQAESLRQIDLFYKSHNFDPGDGMLKLKQAARDCFLRSDDYALWKSTFPESVQYTLSDKTLPFFYRFFYAIGSKGFFYPLKIYRWLSSIK